MRLKACWGDDSREYARHPTEITKKGNKMRLMRTSEGGLALIKKYEGCILEAYRCPAGVWTIGYGHTHRVTKGMSITEEIAESLLREDVLPIEKLLNGMGINFRQCQFDALVSFVFNVGEGNFNTSTLKKKIVAGAADGEIAAEFKKWNKGGGKVLPGLIRRREEEAATWMG